MTEAPLLVRHDALTDRIWVAGEPEWECEQRRRRDGIPLAPGLVRQLRETAAAAGVPFSLAS